MKELAEMSLGALLWIVAIWMLLAVGYAYGEECPPGTVPANTPTGCITVPAGPGCYVEFGELECSDNPIECLDETISDRELIVKYGTVGSVCSFGRDAERRLERCQNRARKLAQRLRAYRRAR